MYKSRWLSLVLAVVLLGVLVTGAAAQSLYFGVDRLEIHVYINTDNTMTLDYTYQFNNTFGGAPIDYVDIGLPTTDYNLSDIQADANGKNLTDIGASPYVDGIAIGLGSQTIKSGSSGNLHVSIANLPGILFIGQNINNETYASFNFQPNYFGSDYVTGSTDMTVTLHLPPGLEPEEPRYYTPTGWPGEADPVSSYDAENRVVYSWRSTAANPSGQYKFGASFPSRLVDQSTLIKPTIWQQSGVDPEDLFIWGCCLGFVGLFIFIVVTSTKAARQRKLKYLPPKIAVEGHGIKRGLTAIEAAILMEQPLDKVFTMMLFSTVKKNAAIVTSREPLKITTVDPQPENLQPYEVEFLQAFKLEKPAEKQKALQEMMVNIVKSLTEKMKGFSRKETIAYYESIMRQAWEQVESAGTPEVKSEKYDQVMEWTMLDKDYEGRTRNTFNTGPVYVPMWWGRFDPGYRTPSTSTSGSSSGGGMPSNMGGGTSVSLPSLPGSTFAASVVNTVQNFSSGVVGDITDFTSRITNRTNPVPVSTSTSRSSGGFRGGGGGGGGRSCACACACAGCACACAGGGR